MLLDGCRNFIKLVCIAVFKISEDLDDWEFRRLLHIGLLLHCNEPVCARVRLHDFFQRFLLFEPLHANLTASVDPVWGGQCCGILISVGFHVICLEFWDCILPVEIGYVCLLYRKISLFFWNSSQVRLWEVLSGVRLLCKTGVKVSERALFRCRSFM